MINILERKVLGNGEALDETVGRELPDQASCNISVYPTSHSMGMNAYMARYTASERQFRRPPEQS